jgi:hypothetical protein
VQKPARSAALVGPAGYGTSAGSAGVEPEPASAAVDDAGLPLGAHRPALPLGAVGRGRPGRGELRHRPCPERRLPGDRPIGGLHRTQRPGRQRDLRHQGGRHVVHEADDTVGH